MKAVNENWRELMEELRRIGRRGFERPAYTQNIHGLLLKEIPNLILYEDLARPDADRLVHYTSWENALNMFSGNENPVLRMYNYEQSNDPDEGKIRPGEWKDVLRNAEWADKILENDARWMPDLEYGGNTYGCSFSSGGKDIEDDLTYWMMYGNNGEGCSFKITPPSGYKHRVYRIRYRDRNFSERSAHEKKEDKDVADRLQELFTICKEIVDKATGEHQIAVKEIIAQGLREIVYGYYHLIKHKDYEGEQEWRMIKVAPETKEIRFDTTAGKLVKRYIEGPGLKEILSSASVITIGPTVPNRGAARAYIEHLARTKHGIRYVAVKNSRQTYRRRA